jgi:hypothetical protein
MPRLRSYVPLPPASSATARREMALRRALRKLGFRWRKEIIGGAVRYSAETMKDPRSRANAIREPLVWLSLESIEGLAADIERRAKARKCRETREDAEEIHAIEFYCNLT